jgi:hypothetical protein
MASPMPRLAPVTRATLPSRGFLVAMSGPGDLSLRFYILSCRGNGQEMRTWARLKRLYGFGLAHGESFSYNPVDFRDVFDHSPGVEIQTLTGHPKAS